LLSKSTKILSKSSLSTLSKPSIALFHRFHQDSPSISPFPNLVLGSSASRGGNDAARLKGLLLELKLSEAESTGLKEAWRKEEGGVGGESQAVGKLFSKKVGNADGIA
jgi:hypothetical protein